MKNKLLYIALLLPWALVLNSCEKIESLPDVAQPIILQYSEKSTFVVGDTTITTGALKDYEQDSEVIFKLTVTSNSNLSKYFVTSTSDAVSNLSRVLRTEPADAMDISGNFIKKLNSVVVYYAYHIHPSVPILSIPVVSFNFQNEKQYVGVSSQIFTVIKKGSTQGKRLTVIDMPYETRFKNGIGSQPNLGFLSGYRNGGGTLPNRRGPFFSFAYKSDIWVGKDAETCADKIDLTGFLATSSRTNDPTIVGGQWYLVSPSDTIVLTSTYAGALIAKITLAGGATNQTANITVNGITRLATYVTSTTVTATNFVTAHKAAYLAAGVNVTASAAVLSFNALNDGVGFGSPTKVIPTLNSTLYGNDALGIDPLYNVYGSPGSNLNADIALRQTIRGMASNLVSNGKSLRKAYFKRLDNSTGLDKISVDYFYSLTHDNEFDVLLGNIVAGGKTVGGPVGFDQVWGFVLDDGRRGLIRTTPPLAKSDVSSAGLEAVTTPNTNPYTLYCQIKIQENK